MDFILCHYCENLIPQTLEVSIFEILKAYKYFMPQINLLMLFNLKS